VDELRRALDRAFGTWSVQLTEGPGHASELAAAALDEGADIVAAVGGDGTCHEVVNGFFDGQRHRARRVIFAAIPWGTGSDLARTICAPGTLQDALWVAATGMTLPTDVAHLRCQALEGGTVEQVFINVAGFGANGDIVSRTNRSSKRWGGVASYLGSTLQSLLAYESWKVEIDWSGPDGDGQWQGPLLSAFLANGAYCGGGMWVGRGGTMHDGCLDLTMLPPTHLARTLSEIWRLYEGSAWKATGARRSRVHRLQARSLEDDRPVLLDVDGEQPGCLPIAVEVLPSALQVRGGWITSPLLERPTQDWRPQ
jgi:diacylglycerol kinase (ATP)